MTNLLELRLAERERTDGPAWAMWMVQRLRLCDPELQELDLSGVELREPQVLRVLMEALPGSPHLRALRLSRCGLEGSAFAAAVSDAVRGGALEVIELESNAFAASELQTMLRALKTNRTLTDFRCCNQFTGETTFDDVVRTAKEALSENDTLLRLGLDIPPRSYHLEDINKALIRNWEALRIHRRASKPWRL